MQKAINSTGSKIKRTLCVRAPRAHKSSSPRTEPPLSTFRLSLFLPLAALHWGARERPRHPGGGGRGAASEVPALLSGPARLSTYLCNLHTPVEQVLGADVVLVLADIVQEAAKGHELRDELHRGRQADAQEAAHVGIVHTGHHIGFLCEEERGEESFREGPPAPLPWLKGQAGGPPSRLKTAKHNSDSGSPTVPRGGRGRP